METFETTFENATKEPVTVFDGTRPLIVLYPSREKTVESSSPRTMYARWTRVIYKPGRVELVPRSGFVEPDRGRWVIEALNAEGREVEQRTIGGTVCWLPRGIPVLVSVSPENPEAKNKVVRIEKSMEWVEDPDFLGYIVRRTILKDTWVERDAGELEELRWLLDGDNQ